MSTLVIATRNQGKIAEISRFLTLSNSSDLDSSERRIEIRSVGEFDLPDVAETGATFEANALLKAETIARATGFAALADDSGLSVDALGGAPGIYSARYAGVHGNDQANIEKLLSELAGIGDAGRSGEFVAVLALAKPDGTHIIARGELRGKIADAKRGSNGFGYDPIFIPEGETRTLGEFTAEQKDQISHRARALASIVPKIRPFIFGTDI